MERQRVPRRFKRGRNSACGKNCRSCGHVPRAYQRQTVSEGNEHGKSMRNSEARSGSSVGSRFGKAIHPNCAFARYKPLDDIKNLSRGTPKGKNVRAMRRDCFVYTFKATNPSGKTKNIPVQKRRRAEPSVVKTMIKSN